MKNKMDECKSDKMDKLPEFDVSFDGVTGWKLAPVFVIKFDAPSEPAKVVVKKDCDCDE